MSELIIINDFAQFEQMLDPDSDFNVERNAEKAKSYGEKAISMIERLKPEFAEFFAKEAGKAANAALDSLERRKAADPDDDPLELFC